MTHSKRIHAMLIAAFLIACILGAGCTSQPEGPGAPTETPAPAEEFVFNETANNTTVTLQAGSGITIHLAENPTTGYGWNVTSSRGLQYVNDTFIPPDTGLVGAGGVHEWQYLAAEKGTGEFSAIYRWPWENVTGNETTFSMTFTIE
jgi:inhibitor of cysteine peptidase